VRRRAREKQTKRSKREANEARQTRRGKRGETSKASVRGKQGKREAREMSRGKQEASKSRQQRVAFCISYYNPHSTLLVYISICYAYVVDCLFQKPPTANCQSKTF
jgi:hypothetical protein